MGVSKERAQNSIASSLKSAAKHLRRDVLCPPNAPLPLAKQASSLPMFLSFKNLPEPLTRWVPISSVFPSTETRATDDQVRTTATRLIETTSHDLDSLPSLTITLHLPSEWGGEIFGTNDTEALAAYAAMDFAYVPVKITRSHRFIDANLRLRFPATSTPAARLKVASFRLAENLGLKGLEYKNLPFLMRQEQEVATLWRIHDCLRDFLLEGELIRNDALRQFTATIKGESLFPWLADDRMDVFGKAFHQAHPRQARHGTVPTTPEGLEGARRATLPPSISSDD